MTMPLLINLNFPTVTTMVTKVIVRDAPISFNTMNAPVLINIRSNLSNGTDLASGLLNLMARVTKRMTVLRVVTNALVPLFMMTLVAEFFNGGGSFARKVGV